MRSSSQKFNTGQYIVDVCCMTCIEIENNCKITISVSAKISKFFANIQSVICHNGFNVKYTHD